MILDVNIFFSYVSFSVLFNLSSGAYFNGSPQNGGSFTHGNGNGLGASAAGFHGGNGGGGGGGNGNGYGNGGGNNGYSNGAGNGGGFGAGNNGVGGGFNGNGGGNNGYSNGGGNDAGFGGGFNGNGGGLNGNGGFGGEYSDDVDPITALSEAIIGGGVPGEDYPILSYIPDTGFECTELPGYYADVNEEAGCQVCEKYIIKSLVRKGKCIFILGFPHLSIRRTNGFFLVSQW